MENSALYNNRAVNSIVAVESIHMSGCYAVCVFVHQYDSHVFCDASCAETGISTPTSPHHLCAVEIRRTRSGCALYCAESFAIVCLRTTEYTVERKAKPLKEEGPLRSSNRSPPGQSKCSLCICTHHTATYAIGFMPKPRIILMPQGLLLHSTLCMSEMRCYLRVFSLPSAREASLQLLCMWKIVSLSSTV